MCLGGLQLYHAKAETCLYLPPNQSLFPVATLPCQSGNFDNRLLPNMITTLLQLYHAKAETRTRFSIASRPSAVATLPCQSGNVCPREPSEADGSCNFTMPKRKRVQGYGTSTATFDVATLPCQSGNFLRRERVFSNGGLLQLYHAKAETLTCRCFQSRFSIVATLPCQSGNVLDAFEYRLHLDAGCNFTMPKRKPFFVALRHGSPLVATLPCQSGNVLVRRVRWRWSARLQLYHAKAETRD